MNEGRPGGRSPPRLACLFGQADTLTRNEVAIRLYVCGQRAALARIRRGPCVSLYNICGLGCPDDWVSPASKR